MPREWDIFAVFNAAITTPQNYEQLWDKNIQPSKATGSLGGYFCECKHNDTRDRDDAKDDFH